MALLIFEGLAHAQKYALKNYFPLAGGATWTYRTIKTDPPNDIEVNCIKSINDQSLGKIYRKFLFDSGEQEEFYGYEDLKWSKSGLEVYRRGYRNLSGAGGYTLFDPPVIRFPASMLIGQTFTQNGTSTDFDLDGNQIGKSYSFSWEITLQGVETVQVGIGTLADCLRFEIASEGEQYTLWLARGIGVVKSQEAEGGDASGILSFTKGSRTYHPTP
jgi:hypothetical protein